MKRLRFHGLKAGPKLLVLGAVHGNETCGPNAIARIIEDCRTGRLLIKRGEVTFVPVTNPKAYRQNTREGDRNLNRDMYERPQPVDNEDRIGRRLCALLREHDSCCSTCIPSAARASPSSSSVPRTIQARSSPSGMTRPEFALAACLRRARRDPWLARQLRADHHRARERLNLPPLAVTEGFTLCGPNTEDTPTIAEAAAFRGGVVMAQLNRIVDRLPRIDIPSDWIDFVVPGPKPYLIDPLLHARPRQDRNENVLMAMIAMAAGTPTITRCGVSTTASAMPRRRSN